MSSRYRIFLMLVFLATIGAVAFPSAMHADIWYVATTGANINAGTESAPWRDIQYAVSSSPAVDGDTIIVENGTYVENLVISTKEVVVASRYLFSNNADDIDNTIIDGDADGSVVVIANNSRLIGFTITNGDAMQGGGIHVSESGPHLSFLHVQGNHALVGGGLFLNSSDAVLSNMTVTGNSADGNGGGLYVEASDIYCSNTTVSYNTSSESGGGLYINSGSPELTGLVVQNNASSMNGGGAYFNDVTPICRDIALLNNETLGNGGGFYLDSVIAEFDLLTIEYNHAVSGVGGGIYSMYSMIGIDSSSVQYNIAGSEGGGIFAEVGALKLTTSTVSNNEAQGGGLGSGNGGGICLAGASPFIYNSTISSNTVQSGSGGGLYQSGILLFEEEMTLPEFFDGLEIGVHNSYIENNSASESGGGYYVEGFGGGRGMPESAGFIPVQPFVTVANSTISYNSTGSIGGGLYGNNIILTMQGSSIGYNSAGEGGGGIYLGESQAVLLQSNIFSNQTLTAGGGMMVENSDVYSDSTSYYNNHVLEDIDHVARGGAVYHHGMYSGFVPPLPVGDLPPAFDSRTRGYRAAEVHGNSAKNGGGGMYLNNVSLSVLNSVIRNNTTFSDHGGGIYAYTTQLRLDSTQVLFNSTPENGGGIFLGNSDIYADHSGFEGNVAGFGGGVYHGNPYDGDDALPTEFEGWVPGFSNTEFNANAAEGPGGGLYLIGVRDALVHSSLTLNTAQHGGGLYVDTGYLVIDSTDVIQNTASISGGGMYASYCEVYSTGATFTYNDAVTGNGGAIFQQLDVGLTMPISGATSLFDSLYSGRVAGYAGATIAWNTAALYGGGINLYMTAPALMNSTIHDNSCTLDGGGIALYGGDSGNNFSQMTGLTIQHNSGGNGGGLAVDSANIVLSNSTLLDNSSSGFGGGLYVRELSPAIDSITVQGNTSGYDGGGVYFVNSTPAMLSNLTVADNSAAGSGGGLYIKSSTIALSNADIRGNAGAGYGGGGVYITTSQGSFENMLISGNFSEVTYLADCGGGGGFYARLCSTMTMTNVTVTGNRTEDNGGGILMSASPLLMMNSIVWNNNAGVINDNIGLCSLATARAHNSVIDPATSLTESVDNIGCDPLFVEAVDYNNAPTVSGDLHLQDYSLAIGSGVTFATINGVGISAPGQDIEQVTRGSVPDIGAYEHALDMPASTITALNDEMIICGSDSVEVDVLYNDTDIFEGIPLIISYTQGTRGTVSYGMDGLFLVYTPDSLYSGVDTFTYTVSTANCGVPTTASVTIYSDPVMVAPVISGESTVRSGGAEYIYTAASTSGTTYSWFVENGSIVSSSGSSITVTWNDTYMGTVGVTAATALGCSISETMDVRIYHPGPVYHVCSTGSNATGTGSELLPLADIEEALTLAQDGDTVLVCPGEYDDFMLDKNVVVASWFLTTGDTSYISQTIINSYQDYTAIVIAPGLSSTASLIGLTVTGGANDEGGGISVGTESRPVLRNLIVTGNIATYGGGIYIDIDAAPQLSDIVIHNNVAISGAGLVISPGAAPQVSNTEIRDNSAYYIGGGIAMVGAAPLLSNVTISGNTCMYEGGGIYMAVSTPQLSNCTIENNTVESGDGGGIYIAVQPEEEPMPVSRQVVTSTTGMVIDNSIIRNNSAIGGDGGGVYMVDSFFMFPSEVQPQGEPEPSDPWEITITNTVIDSNYATGSGGGISMFYIEPYIGNVTVADNSCGEDGGGIYIERFPFLPPVQPAAGMPLGDARIDSSVVKRNQAGRDGGGIFVSAGKEICAECSPSVANIPSEIPFVQYISASLIDSNSASGYGGGISVNAGAVVGMELSRVSHNIGGWSGGVDVWQAMALIEQSTIDSNISSNGSGGLCAEYAQLLLASSSISHNTLLSGDGGGIKGSYSLVQMDSLSVTNNTAPLSGGGLYFYETDVALFNSTVSDNSTGGSGGGLSAESCYQEISNTTFRNNTSVGSGGGIHVQYGTMEYDSVEVTANISGGNGGGLYTAEVVDAVVSHSVFSNNSADSSGGGATLEYSSINVDSTSFIGNTAGGNGGGLQVYFSAAELINITVAGNSAGGSGGGIYRYSEPGDGMPSAGDIAVATPFIANAAISGNFSGASEGCEGGGGLMVINTGEPVVIVGATITGNRTNGMGGALHASSAEVNLVNSILWNNAADSGSDIDRCSSAVVYAYHSVLHSAEVDSSYAVVECDPQFVAAVSPAAAPTTTGNLRLSDVSPAIGMGVESIALAVGTVSMTSTDIEGTTHGTPPDIGAFENALDVPITTIVAADDTVHGCMNTPLNIDVLANDTGANSEIAAFVEYSQGTSGTVSVESGTLLYTPNADFLGTDSFTYVVSTNACLRPDTALVVVHIGRYPALVVSGTNAVCSFSTHTFTVQDTNSVAASYSWSIGAQGAVSAPAITSGASSASVTVEFGEFNGETTVSLVVVAETASGCVYSQTFDIDGYSQPLAHAGDDIAVCSGSTIALGSTDGEINTTATGGSGLYSYSWTPADGLDNAASAQPEVTATSTSTFTVVVTDLITGCTATDDITVTVYKQPALVIDVTSGCGGQITTYTATDTNNTGASIHWNTEMLSCGTVVENTNGMLSVMWSSVSETTTCDLFVSAVTPQECEASFNFAITIHPSPVPAISGSQSICLGATESYTVADDNSTGASYEWSVIGGTIVEGASSATISVLWSSMGEGSTGEVSVVATSPYGCMIEASMDVQRNANPVVGITGTDSVFAGTLHEYAVATENTGLTYSWSANGGTVVGAATGSTVAVRWNTSGTVTVAGAVVLSAVSSEGCSTTVQLPVDIYPFIPVDIAGDSTTVGDTTGVYGVAGVDTTAASFAWTISTGGTIVGSTTGATVTVEWEDVDEPTTGTITVQVQTMDGGTGSTTFTVTIYPRPILLISGDFDVCSDEEQTYSVVDSRNLGTPFGWFATGGTIVGSSTGATVTVKWDNTTSVSAASLTVVGYEPHGFNGASTASVLIYANPVLMIAGPSELCGTAEAVYIVSDANATGITAFTWSVIGGAIVGDATGSAVNIVWDNVSAMTTRTISVSGAGINGCTSSTSFDVMVQPLPVVTVNGENEVCAEAISVYSAVDINSGKTTFMWSVDGGTIIGGQGTTTATVQWIQPGSRSVRAVAVSDVNCSDSLVFDVDVFAKPQPEITGLREVCADSTAMLDAGDGYASYLWSNGAQTRTIAVATSGTYSVTVTTESGCSASTSTTVTYLPSVVADAGDDVEICSGSSVQLQGVAVSYIGAVSFRWSPATGLSNPDIADPIASPTKTTTYSLLVTDGYGCSIADEVTVVVKPEPEIQITGNTVICTGGNTQLFVTGGISYSWSPATGLSNPNIANPVVTPTTTTIYTVTIVSTTACTVQRTVTVTVVDPQFVHAGSDVEICAGASTQLQASGGVTYSWSPATGLSNPNIANPVASPTETTTYTVTATGLGECISVDQVTVTVHPLELNIAVLLEGPFNGTGMATTLQQQGLIPAAQPFGAAPFSYNGTETTDGSVANVVDWVLLELRSGVSPGSAIARQAALLLADGTVVAADGSAVKVGNISTGSTPVYVVVWHRNHLPVMSSVQIAPTHTCSIAYDFTGSLASAYTQFMNAQIQLGTAGAPYGLVSGDVNGDGVVNATDRVMINNTTGQLGYLSEDISLDGIVNAVDRVRVRNNTFHVTQVP